MLRSYLKAAFRNVSRHKGYAAINVVGLAVGIAVCLLIALYVRDEWSYDRFHERGDRIYRLVNDVQASDGSTQKVASIGWPYGRILASEFPEVEKVVYLRAWPSFPVLHQGRYHYDAMYYADEHFFDVFSFPVVEGDPEEPLAEPYTVVLTRETARKYFGDEPAVGRSIVVADTVQLTVTAVVDIPRTSHLQFDELVSFATLCAMTPGLCEAEFASGWFDLNVYNYVLLREGVDPEAFQAKIKDLAMQKAGEGFRAMGYRLTLHLQPLHNIYLRSDRGNGLGPVSDISYVYLLSAIALFVLVLACINFVNLATARATERAREVGIRKVAGSSRLALIHQFLSESFLTCVLAVVVTFGLLSVTMPLFNDLAGKSFRVSDLLSPSLVLVLTGFILLVSVLAGFYPAVVLAGFRPAEVLKGSYSTGRRGVRLRQALVVFQFSVSCVLIVSTLVVLHQLRFMQNRDPGFQKDQVVVMNAARTSWDVRTGQYETIKRELTAHPAVRAASAAFALPGRSGWQGQVAFPEGRPTEQGVNVEYLAVDQDFVETLGLEIVAGRDFSETFATDAEEALLVNETAVEVMGWGSPERAIGKRITSPSGYPEGTVIGVVKDYHQRGFQEHIGPIVMDVNPGAFRVYALRVDTDQAADVLAHMERIWSRFFGGHAFDYYFLDEDFARQYESERRLATVFGVFSGLAVLIACLGLFGLAAYTTLQRTKEIGIRKVLGASVAGILALLSKDFLKLVFVAVLLSAPVAYLAMDRWLQDFAYRIELGPGLFVLAGGIALIIAFLTVSYQSVRTALTDPAKSLRYE